VLGPPGQSHRGSRGSARDRCRVQRRRDERSGSRLGGGRHCGRRRADAGSRRAGFGSGGFRGRSPGNRGARRLLLQPGHAGSLGLEARSAVGLPAAVGAIRSCRRTDRGRRLGGSCSCRGRDRIHGHADWSRGRDPVEARIRCCRGRRRRRHLRRDENRHCSQRGERENLSKVSAFHGSSSRPKPLASDLAKPIPSKTERLRRGRRPAWRRPPRDPSFPGSRRRERD
jgi:hypothetical protein